MTTLSLLPVFLIGLSGGVHCVGMCGGIAGAFSVAAPAKPAFPVAVRTQGAGSVAGAAATRILSFNAGRIGSYMLAGAIMAGLAGGVQSFVRVLALQTAGYWLANLMLVALGLSLMGAWQGVARLEALGQILWRRVQPLMKPMLPVQNRWQAFALGGLWGWVPCGMVYSVLMTAMVTGSPVQGALVMLAFGLGTLPLLAGMGLAGTRLAAVLKMKPARRIAGLVVLSFGVLGLVRVVTGVSHGWLDALCLTPAL